MGWGVSCSYINVTDYFMDTDFICFLFSVLYSLKECVTVYFNFLNSNIWNCCTHIVLYGLYTHMVYLYDLPTC